MSDDKLDPMQPVRDVMAAAQALYDDLDEVWSAIKALALSHGYDVDALLEVPGRADEVLRR